MRWRAVLLVLAAMATLTGCAYWLVSDTSLSTALIVTTFEASPEWLDPTKTIYVADGALWLLDEAVWELPYHTADFSLDFEFSFVEPQTAYFGVGILFDCLMEGTYALWIYQSDAWGEDRYQLWRYGMDSDSLTVAHGACPDLRITESNTVSVTVRDGNVTLEVNGQHVALIEGVRASGSKRLAMRGENTGLAIDSLQLLGTSE